MTDLRSDLISAAGHFYQKGWMVGTAGNLSARLSDGSFWITASGRAKGQLRSTDFVRIAPDGTPIELSNCHETGASLKPSAETSIHQVVYRLFPDARACYHVHSVEANLAARFANDEDLPLPPLEMLKGLGVWIENPQCVMPIFPNHFQVERIAAEIEQRLSDRSPDVPALLIRDHGVTVWADSTTAAFHAIELVEYIFRYIVTDRFLLKL